MNSNHKPLMVEFLARGGAGKTTVVNNLVLKKKYLSRRQAVLAIPHLLYRYLPSFLIALLFHLKIKIISTKITPLPGFNKLAEISMRHSRDQSFFKDIDHIFQHLVSFTALREKTSEGVVLLDEGMAKYGMLISLRGGAG